VIHAALKVLRVGEHINKHAPGLHAPFCGLTAVVPVLLLEKKFDDYGVLWVAPMCEPQRF
jgi:hypothetical protein